MRSSYTHAVAMRILQPNNTSEFLAGCRIMSVSSLGVAVVNCSKVWEHSRQNCEARKWQFLLPERVEHHEQLTASDGDWQWLWLSRTTLEGSLEQSDADTCRWWCRVCRQSSAALATSEGHLWVSVYCYQSNFRFCMMRREAECRTDCWVFMALMLIWYNTLLQ